MMKQSLRIRNSMRNVNITNNTSEMSRIILNTMLFALAGLAFWYVLTLGNMVFDIVQRKTLEKEISNLANEVGQLELTYLSAAGKMDMELSASMGFKETPGTFATRKSLGSLSFANNEI